MERLEKKVKNLKRRKYRVRARVTGTTERPRLTVFISNLHVTAQIVDDSKSKTIVYVTSVDKKTAAGGTMTERAAVIGTEIAKKAKAAKVTNVVFDRNGRLYHGRIKALADAARAGGLEF